MCVSQRFWLSVVHTGFGLFIYLGFYIAFNTVQVISRRVVGMAEETSTYNWSKFCTVNCRPTASNYQLSHLRLCRELNPGLRGGRRECYHSATMAPHTGFGYLCLLLVRSPAPPVIVVLLDWLGSHATCCAWGGNGHVFLMSCCCLTGQLRLVGPLLWLLCYGLLVARCA